MDEWGWICCKGLFLLFSILVPPTVSLKHDLNMNKTQVASECKPLRPTGHFKAFKYDYNNNLQQYSMNSSKVLRLQWGLEWVKLKMVPISMPVIEYFVKKQQKKSLKNSCCIFQESKIKHVKTFCADLKQNRNYMISVFLDIILAKNANSQAKSQQRRTYVHHLEAYLITFRFLMICNIIQMIMCYTTTTAGVEIICEHHFKNSVWS